jgi:orotidine-5'-phosphate decarboxylase
MARLIVALDHYDKVTELRQYQAADGIKLTAAALVDGFFDEVCAASDKYESEWAPDNIFLDLKIADISFRDPYGDLTGTNHTIIRSIEDMDYPVTHVSVHGFLGRQGVEEVVAACTYITPLVLIGMTAPHTKKFLTRDVSMQILQEIKGLKIGGLIVPGNDLKLLERVRCETDLPVWSPGFGRQSYGLPYSDLREWRNLVGPDPRNTAIIGSMVTNSSDPADQIEWIKEAIW